jgi:hypothetical protein
VNICLQVDLFRKQDRETHCHTHQVYKPTSSNVETRVSMTLRSGPTCLQKMGRKGAESGLAGPTPRPASLLGGSFSFSFVVDSPPPLRINLHHVWRLVWSRFIQRWSRELTRIDDMEFPCPLLHLPYKRTSRPPLGRYPLRAISHSDQNTLQERNLHKALKM